MPLARVHRLTPLLLLFLDSAAFTHRADGYRLQTTRAAVEDVGWPSLEARLPSLQFEEPSVVDSVLRPDVPKPLVGKITLLRERNGWCPYSERVWLALEHKNVEYETILIDNMGNGRPKWFRGTTPQICWPDGRMQGESMDLVEALDTLFPTETPLWPPAAKREVDEIIANFRRSFPKNTRPSSRSAFLFKSSGAPVFRADFEACLDATESLLSKREDGPFFLGRSFTAGDLAWLPFLERYSHQLPVLHPGLEPRKNLERWPHLAAWFEGVETLIPASERCLGDAVSWRKVLAQSGFGNSGRIPSLHSKFAGGETGEGGIQGRSQDNWARYASTRFHVGETPSVEAACRIVRNRELLVKDALTMWRRSALARERCRLPVLSAEDAGEAGCPSEAAVLEGLGELALWLLLEPEKSPSHPPLSALALSLAAYIDERVCVPRDMEWRAAAKIRALLVASE